MSRAKTPRIEPFDAPYRVVVIPDTQVPYHDVLSTRAVLQFMRSNYVDCVVHIGDLMDYDILSRHNAENIRAIENKSLDHDNQIGNAFLDDIEDAARMRNEHCEFAITLGNHDIRPQTFVDKVPQLRGMIEIENTLNFAKRGWKVVHSYDRGELLQIGKMTFVHGAFHSANAAKKHLDRFGCNLTFGHCFDEATEILTQRGWLLRADLLPTDSVCTLNEHTGQLEMQALQHITDIPAGVYTELCSIQSRNVDLMLTDKHGMVDYCGGKLRRFNAEDFTAIETRRIPVTGMLPRAGVDLTDDEIRLCVWIAADGSLDQVKGLVDAKPVRWHFKKQRKIDELTALLSRMGIWHSVRPQKSGSVKVYVNMRGHRVANLFTWNEGTARKVLPNLLIDCNAAQARVVLEAYVATDGHRYSEHAVQISTAKRAEADLLQTIFVTNGIRCNATKRKHTEEWTLAVNTMEAASMVSTKRAFSVQPYAGSVWCVTVPNGTVMVRRNGKVTITQNTHRTSIETKSMLGTDKTIAAFNIGSLCDPHIAYAGHGEHNGLKYAMGNPALGWQQAFLVLDFLFDKSLPESERGSFTAHLTMINNHRFVGPDGRVYDGARLPALSHERLLVNPAAAPEAATKTA
jgi:predicted phosphodiesterase